MQLYMLFQRIAAFVKDLRRWRVTTIVGRSIAQIGTQIADVGHAAIVCRWKTPDLWLGMLNFDNRFSPKSKFQPIARRA